MGGSWDPRNAAHNSWDSELSLLCYGTLKMALLAAKGSSSRGLELRRDLQPPSNELQCTISWTTEAVHVQSKWRQIAAESGQASYTLGQHCRSCARSSKPSTPTRKIGLHTLRTSLLGSCSDLLRRLEVPRRSVKWQTGIRANSEFWYEEEVEFDVNEIVRPKRLVLIACAECPVNG